MLLNHLLPFLVVLGGAPALATSPDPTPRRPLCESFVLDEGIDTLEFLRSTINSLSRHIAILDDTGQVIVVNNAWTQFGQGSGVVTGRAPLGSDYPALCEQGLTALGGTHGTIVARWARLTLAGGTEELRFVYPCHGLESRRWFQLHGSYFQLQGKRHIVVTHQDITGRVVLAEQLLAMGRAQAVSRILSGFAHDMNNVLTVLAGHASLSLATSPEGPMRDHARVVVDASERVIAMVHRLSQLTPRTNPSVSAIAVRGAVEHVLDTIVDMPPNVALVRNLAYGVGDIRLSQTDLHMVLNELIRNAVAAMPATGGEITVTLERGAFAAATLPTGLDASEAGYLRITVSDNGSGIPAELVPRLFDPLFRRDARDPRVGLGFSVVNNVMSGAHGGVSIDSAVGRGTTVALYFPASRLAPGPVVGESAAVSTPAGRYILLVDDDDAVLTVTRISLESVGFLVRPARSVSQARALLDSDVGLVLTDYAMPEGGGFALAGYVREQNPNLPVLVYSGEADRLARPTSVTALVAKPFRLSELRQLIERYVSPTL